MMDFSFLPHVNASLNALATVLLVSGWVAVKTKRITLHKTCMGLATATSLLFLICYVTHYVWRAKVVGGVHTKFNHEGFFLIAYYMMLITHILLAMTVPFFACRLIWLGVGQKLAQHRRLARWGFPIWLYVSVTGVMIYLALYHFNPGGADV